MELFDIFDMIMALDGHNDNGRYEEIRKLDQLLTEANIPHEFRSHLGGFQILYFGPQGRPKTEPGVIQGPGVGAVCSAIENRGSYGSENDRIEISGLLTEEEYRIDSVKGNLTAEDVFERIRNHWNQNQPE